MNAHADPAVAIPEDDFCCDDAPIPLRGLYPDAPVVFGVPVTDELLAAVGRVEAALAVARVAHPGLAFGDLAAGLHLAVRA